MTNSIKGAALEGIQRGFQRIAEKADRISRGFSSESDITSDIIGLKEGERQVRASASLIKTEDELEKTVLDILA